jgi:transcriptional regulator with XRE-family HTH domain
MEQLKRLRTEKGLSQAKLAVMAGMDPATLNRLEQGKGNPSLRTLERVANALDVNLAELLEDANPKGGRRSSREPSLFNGLEEEWRLEQGGAVPDLWQPGLAVLYREIAKKGRTVGERLKAGQLEDFTELVEFGAASAVLAKLRGPRDIRGHEPDELAGAIDEFEAADKDIQDVLRQDLSADLSEEQRQQLAAFRRKRDEISSAAETKRSSADAS